MAGIERDNPALKGVLPKDYARPALDKTRLGQIIDLISNVSVGDEAARAKDVLGRVYEYFLSQFASAEGKKGGEFYTPRCVVKLLVETLEPYRGRVYDPCCGSSGMFVQSVDFVRAHANGTRSGTCLSIDRFVCGTPVWMACRCRYPPDKQATQTVLEQAALLSAEWVPA
jgi:type I restriction enzyme M protein